jgi:two-component system, LytTR family, response regulator
MSLRSEVPPGGEHMEPIRTLIVDDEPLARRNLLIRLGRIPDFEVIGECGTGEEAVAAVAERRPDVVFLDIRMPDMDGFEVLERIESEILPVVVFVTAYDRYALEAFRVHALDYLLKPFEDDRFGEALQACRQRVAEVRRLAAAPEAREKQPTTAEESEPPSAGLHLSAPGSKANPYLDRVVIKSMGRIQFMRIASIDWVEAYGNYVSLHAGEKTWLLRRTMHEMEAGLDPRVFSRISRSAIVNLDRIHELEPVTRGEYLVRLTTGKELKLTRGYREKLEAAMGDRF